MQSVLQYRNIHHNVRSKNQLKSPIVGSTDAIDLNGSRESRNDGDECVREANISSSTPSTIPTSQSTQQVIEGEQRACDSEDRVASTRDLEKADYADAPHYTVVGFDDAYDPLNPQNWSYGYKWMVTGVVSTTSFIVTGASAIDSEITPQLMQDFGVGEEVALLGTALFMIAFGLGSLVSAPFSEILGRNPVYIVSTFRHVSGSLSTMSG